MSEIPNKTMNLKIEHFGLIHIYYGNGKGKTCAAIGQIVRALGYGYNVLIARFLKTEKWTSGEINILKQNTQCTIMSAELSSPFFYNNNSNITSEKVATAQRHLLDSVYRSLSKHYDIILLDEILNTLPDAYLDEKDILQFIDKKPKNTELILTGRPCPDNILKQANLVTKMQEIKHPFQQNIPARKGIDF